MTNRERYKFIMKDSKELMRTKETNKDKVKITILQIVKFIRNTNNKYYQYRLQRRFLDLYFMLEEPSRINIVKQIEKER